jgi:hypothetical protein
VLDEPVPVQQPPSIVTPTLDLPPQATTNPAGAFRPIYHPAPQNKTAAEIKIPDPRQSNYAGPNPPLTDKKVTKRLADAAYPKAAGVSPNFCVLFISMLTPGRLYRFRAK